MGLYLISYDLSDGGLSMENYRNPLMELRRMGARELLRTQWIWRGENTSASDILSRLSPFIGEKDRLLVSAMGEWASKGPVARIDV